MSYQVFARKYRPKTFADVLGQDHVVRTLRNAIAQNRLAHAYLFVGPRGTGKTSTARIFAKALNCPEGPTVDFDPNSTACIEIAEGRSMDVVEIDGASNNGVDQVRELRENVKFAPAHSRFKIYYIDEVHMLSTAAFNALLKTLEEPPDHVKFIFATTEANKILPTIISRCQRFDLRRISDTTIANHLLHIADLEGVALEEKAAYAIAKGADGGMRDAQSMMDQLVAFCGNKIIESDVLDVFGFTPQEAVCNLAQGILARDTVSALHVVNEQSEAGKDIARMLSDLIQHFRTLLVHQTDPEATSEDLAPEIAAMVAQQSTMGSTEQMLRIVDGLAEVDARMRWASNKRLHFDLGIIQAVASMGEVSLSDVIVALDKAGGTQAEAAAAVQELRATVTAAPPRSPAPAPTPAPPQTTAAPIAAEPQAPVASPQPAPIAVAVAAPASTPQPEPITAPQPAPVVIQPPAPEPSATRLRENPPELVEEEPAPKAAPQPAPLSLMSLLSDEPPAPRPVTAAAPKPAFSLGDDDAPPWNDKPEKPAAPAMDGSKAWAALIPIVAKQRPLFAHWVQSGTQLGFAKGVVKVGFPMSEAHSRESLLREPTQKYLLAILNDLLGQPVKLEFVMDASLSAAAEPEFTLGLDLPVSPAPANTETVPAATPSTPARAPEPAPGKSPAAPRQSTGEAPDEVPYDAFHDDELINLAVAKFKARIVAKS